MIDGPFTRFARGALSAGEPLALVSVARAEGSTPREAGAAMLVTPTAFTGTIGGGRLEWDAIAAARTSLAEGKATRELTIPLGPEIGQCCGGRVTLSIVRQTDVTKAAEADALEADDRAGRHVIVFGAGHVGVALARALAPLPLTVKLVDSRPDVFAGLAINGVECVSTERVTAQIEAAPAGSAFVVLTHSHALDSLIVATALERGDFSYLGLIGSRTKRRLFEKAFRETGIAEERIARIVCPIGSARVKDKRPAVIAALAAAEIIEAQAAGAVAQTARHKREAA